MKHLEDVEKTVHFQPYAAPPSSWDDTARHLLTRRLAELSDEDRVQWVRADQRERWRKGDRMPVEAYLGLPPFADAGDELILDLIYCEWLTRCERGEAPAIAELTGRFPALADRLERLFALDAAFLGDQPIPAGVAAPAAPLQKIGKYPIVSILSEGGQGIVYRALHPTLQKEVVIKWSKQSASAQERDQLLSEGRILARSEHPNLVRVFDLDFHEGRPFLVMEAVQAITLEEYRERVHPDPSRSARLVAQIARALDEVHQRGVVHRDIKPRNILIDELDRPKLIDFGLATCRHAFAEPAAETDSLSGTLAYIAPEQARGATAGPRGDIFGLGGILHFLLTGKPPYPCQPIREALQAATAGAWDRSALEQAAAPARLRAICTRALAPRAEDRYASARQMADDLDAFLQRPRRLAVGAAACTLAIALLALGLWWGWPRSDHVIELKQPSETNGGNPKKDNPVALPAPSTPSKLAIEVVRKKDGPAFALEDAVPVLTGNELRISAFLPAGRHGVFVHFSEGKLHLLNQEAPEPADRTVSFPQEPGTRVPLLGAAGPELFLFCARAEPITAHDLKTLFADLTAFPAIPNEQALFTLNEREVKSWHRGYLGKATKGMHPEDVAHRQLTQLQSALQRRFDVYAGVLFVHKAAED